MTPAQLERPNEAPHCFATTHWSVVLNAADRASPQADGALETLCRSYWHPLYVYVRRRGYDPDSAEELTQEFFAYLLARELLGKADPNRGKFRSWLLGVLKNFLAHEWSRSRTQKKGGGTQFLSLDEEGAENRSRFDLPDENTPEWSFDRQWAFTVLERAGASLRAEYDASGKLHLYTTLRAYLSLEGAASSYEAAARKLGLSLGGIKTAIYRLRRRYQELVREEIARTVANRGEVDDEIRYLLEVIRS